MLDTLNTQLTNAHAREQQQQQFEHMMFRHYFIVIGPCFADGLHIVC